MSKRILIICRQAPYANSLAREALDIALATSIFEQDLALLFLSDGVWQLHKKQNSETLSVKNHGKIISALPLYDINDIYIDQQALDQRHLTVDDLLINAIALNNEEISSFINSFDLILNF